MTEPQLTPREQNRLAVGRLTKLLAGLAVAATAAFGAVIASGHEAGTAATVDQATASSSADGSSYDSSSDDTSSDGSFGFTPSQSVSPSTATPSATSGGS